MIMKVVIQVVAIVLCLVFTLGGLAEKQQRQYFLPASVGMLLLAILAEIVWRKLL